MANSLEIGNNTGAILRFDKLADLRGFAKAQSDRLASLLYLLKESEVVDEMYFSDVMQIASDMAYELKQAVELMNDRSVENV